MQSQASMESESLLLQEQDFPGTKHLLQGTKLNFNLQKMVILITKKIIIK